MSPTSAASNGPSSVKPLTGPQKALHKLGLLRDIDLALHLPLRYEDETRLVKLRDVREGDLAQVEGRVTHAEVKLGGQRQLLVTLDDGTAPACCVFLAFTRRCKLRWRWANRCGCGVRFAVVLPA